MKISSKPESSSRKNVRSSEREILHVEDTISHQ